MRKAIYQRDPSTSGSKAMGFCSNCGKEMRQDMRYCPSCGAPAADGPATFGPPTLHFNPYPLTAAFPMPFQPQRMLTLERRRALGAARALQVDAVLATLLGFVLVVDSWRFWDFMAGLILLFGAGLSFFSVFAIRRSYHPTLGVMGPVSLMAGAVAIVFVDVAAIVISVIGGGLALYSLGMLWRSWDDSMARHESRLKGLDPDLAVQPTGHPWGGPNPYGWTEPPAIREMRRQG